MLDKEQPLIILKRIEEVAEAKKGGAWKVAHADFMTAMMAFFLIMWLVNATDEEIKKSIANYFNPMNLMAAPSDQRGIDEPSKDATPSGSDEQAGQRAGERPMGSSSPGDGGGAGGGGNVEQGNENRMDSAGILEATDGAAFNDPYATLASSASDIDPAEPVAIDVPQSTLGETGDDAMTDTPRDPFDPTYWQTRPQRQARSLRPGRSETADTPAPAAVTDAAEARPTASVDGPVADPDVAATDPADPQDPNETDAIATHGSPAPHRSVVAAAVLAEFAKTQAPEAPPPADGEAAQAAKLKAEAAAIAREIAGENAEVEVAEGATSVLISLTDGRAFSMFAIGSDVPTPETAALFARVAQSLASRDGKIVVRGHTDARPFAANTSDNWMLSFQRAHATKTALVTNGVAERRIARVEGLADREPKAPENPLADENRRIEILYEPAGVTP